MSDDNQQGAGKQALDSDVLAARAAEQRERDAAALAEREYDLARQAAEANQAGSRLGRAPGRFFGPPPAPPMLEAAATDFASPPAPQFATDTAQAITAASRAMAAIVETLGIRSANNSRGRDGDIVIECEEQANTAVLTVGYLGGGWSGVDLKVENRPILGSLDQLPG